MVIIFLGTMLTYFVAFSQIPLNTLTVFIMYGAINMYPLADGEWADL